MTSNFNYLIRDFLFSHNSIMRAANGSPTKKRRRQNAGLQYRKKHFRPGQIYRFQRRTGSTISNHMLSRKKGYTAASYQKSNLLPNGVLLYEMILDDPCDFIASRDRVEDIEYIQEFDDDASKDSSIVPEASSADNGMMIRSQYSQGSTPSRRSHAEMEQLRVSVAYHFKFVLGLPPKEEWKGQK